MRFVVDAQLPPALARWLVAEGHDARHVFDIDMGRASDDAIWAFAVQNSMVILSKDEDFARRRALVVSGPAVVWIRLPNSRQVLFSCGWRRCCPVYFCCWSVERRRSS